MNILLTNVPGPRAGASRLFFPSYPPLGLAYLAAILEREGHRAVIVDLEHQSLSALAHAADELSPGMIGVSASMPMLKTALRLAQDLRRIAPHARLVVGGPLTTPFARRLAGPELFDLAVTGEAEHVILALAKWAANRADGAELLRGLPGVVVQMPDGIVETQAIAPAHDLDTLPFPARHLLTKKSLYLRHPLAEGYGPATTVLASRGCRFHCSFCYQYPFKALYRRHSPERVCEEIARLKADYGIRFVRFIDDLFTCERDQTLTLCEELARRLPGLHWHCGTRIDQVDAELIRAMHRAGCRVINFGLESGDREDLIRMSKGVREDPREVVEMCAKAGLAIVGQFIIGFPWDTPASIAARVDFAKSLPLAAATFWPLIPMPGTRLFEEAKNRLGEFECDYYERVDTDTPGPLREPVYSPPGMTRRDIQQHVSRAQWSFHLRPRTLLPLLKGLGLGVWNRIVHASQGR